MRTILESTLPAPEHIAEVAPRSSADDALFAELASVLQRHGAIDRFGISLLHRHFDVAPGEVLLETTDIPSRTHTIAPVQMSEIADEPVIETAWRLGDGWVAMGCVCKKYGNEHSHQHIR